jgi:hypothetical protein
MIKGGSTIMIPEVKGTMASLGMNLDRQINWEELINEQECHERGGHTEVLLYPAALVSASTLSVPDGDKREMRRSPGDGCESERESAILSMTAIMTSQRGVI